MARPLRISAATAESLLKRTKRGKGRPKREDARALYFRKLRDELERAESEPQDGKERDPLGGATHHHLKDALRCNINGCDVVTHDFYQLVGYGGPLSISERMCRDCALAYRRGKR